MSASKIIYQDLTVSPAGDLIVPSKFVDKIKKGENNQVTVVFSEGKLMIMNPALFYLKAIQNALAEDSDKKGLHSDGDIAKLLDELDKEGKRS